MALQNILNQQTENIFCEIENTTALHKNLKSFLLWVEQDCFFPTCFYAFSKTTAVCVK